MRAWTLRAGMEPGPRCGTTPERPAATGPSASARALPSSLVANDRRLLFGVGYQGRGVAELLEALTRAGVRTLVDVRLNPVSRRPGFSKRALSSALGEGGIAYVHERSLGNPPENRAAFLGRDPAPARQVLLTRLRGEGAGAMDRLVATAGRAPVAVLCFERARDHCHRAVIMERARELDPAIEVHDIV